MRKTKANFDTKCKRKERAKDTLTVPVKVIYGVAPVVFDVPAEGGEAHAHIQPRQLHSADVGRNVSEHGAIQDRHVVQVPAAAQVVLRIGDTHLLKTRHRCHEPIRFSNHLLES